MIFARKMPNYIIRQRDRGQVKAKCLRPRLRPRSNQSFEAEAKSLRPRPRPKFWPRGLNITAYYFNYYYKVRTHSIQTERGISLQSSRCQK